MTGYTYPNSSQGDGYGTMTATLANLAHGTYDFYLYGHADYTGGGPACIRFL